jgi:TPR repeat protein
VIFNILGVCYVHCDGIAECEAKAVDLYLRVAAAGNTAVVCSRSVCFSCGMCWGTDSVNVVERFSHAADTGIDHTTYIRGYCHERGVGVGKKAVELYKRAVDTDFVDGLGSMFAVMADRALKQTRLSSLAEVGTTQPQ